jgi:osmotically inducible protein OsmC
VPRIVRTTEVVWEGSLSRGSGVANAGTGAFELPIDLPSRVGASSEVTKTSPEELLAAAHSGCYTTGLAGEIASAGGTVERLDVTCTVTMDEVPGKGHVIVSSEIDARVRANGIDDSTLERVARAADDGCPFSALIRATATVGVSARLETT